MGREQRRIGIMIQLIKNSCISFPKHDYGNGIESIKVFQSFK